MALYHIISQHINISPHPHSIELVHLLLLDPQLFWKSQYPYPTSPSFQSFMFGMQKGWRTCPQVGAESLAPDTRKKRGNAKKTWKRQGEQGPKDLMIKSYFSWNTVYLRSSALYTHDMINMIKGKIQYKGTTTKCISQEMVCQNAFLEWHNRT